MSRVREGSPTNISAETSVVIQRFSTQHYAAPHRARVWADMVNSINYAMRITTTANEAYRGDFKRYVAPDYQIVSFSEDDALFEREHGHIRSDGNTVYQFLTPIAGNCQVEHCGHVSLGAPGDIFMLDAAEPFRIKQQGRMSALMLTVRRDIVEAELRQPQRLCGRALNGRYGIARTGLDLLRSVERQSARLAPHEFRRACRQCIELVLLSVEDMLAESIAHSRVRHVNLTRIRNYIRDHLQEPDLATPRIAAGVGLSTRYVQELFKSAGTTARDTIRSERLNRAGELLESPLHRHRSITEIAFACGFSHSSHFSTAFRQYYRISPRECRQKAHSLSLLKAE